MTNQELESRLQELTRKEREITHEILRLIQVAAERRLYLERGYPSLLDWLIKCYHYSAPAAYRRIQAARLLSSIPEQPKEDSFHEKVKSGSLTVSALSKVQSFIKAEEKRAGKKVSVETKTEILKKVENQSIQETEKLLFQSFPEAAKSFQFEKISALSATESKVSLVLDEKSLDDLKRVQELLGHALPESSLSEVVAYLSEEFLKRKDPLLKKSVPAALKGSTKAQGENAPGSQSTNPSPQRFRGAYQKGDGHPSSLLSDPDPKGEGHSSKIGLSKIRKKDQEKRSPKSALKSAAVLHGGERNRPRRAVGCSMETAESKILPQRKALSVPLKRFILQRDQGRCQFRDPRTGATCGSRKQIEIDHIQPVALGGEDRPENLRCLCRSHNQWRGWRTFAKGGVREKGT